MTIILLTRNPTRNKTFFDLQGIFLNLSFNEASNGQTKSYRSLPSLCLRGSSRQLIFHIEKFIISCQVVSLNHSPHYWHPFHTLKQGKSSYSSSFSTSSFCKAISPPSLSPFTVFSLFDGSSTSQSLTLPLYNAEAENS